jgi:hypothetical protein
MGYKINTYSISELKRISTPGRVIPALFWMIPIGKWDYYDLENLWFHFTNNSSRCKELGLFIVKELDKSINLKESSDLYDLTGKLSDLLPSGVNKIYGNEYLYNNEKKHQVLILSGSYPQPGWGIILSFNNYEELVMLLENTLNNIDNDLYEIFIKASDDFKIWDKLKRNKPIKTDFDLLKINQNKCSEIHNLLQIFSSEIKTDQTKNKSYYEIKIIAKQTSYIEFEDDFNEFFKLVNDKFISSLLILKASNILNIDEINSTLKMFLIEHNSKNNNLFKTEKNQKLKQIASILLKLDSLDQPKEEFISWALENYNLYIDEIFSFLNNFKHKLQKNIGQTVLANKEIEDNHNSALKIWQEEVEEKRLLFNVSLQNVLINHLDYSPTFLMQIEKQAKNKGLTSKSVSWDPPRMVGWKILAEGIKIEKIDLTTILNEMVPEFSNYSTEHIPNEDKLVSGSLFTDYVHYISKSDNRITPRIATKNLLEKLLRSSEIIKILNHHSNNLNNQQTISELVNNLLVNLGWPDKKEKYESKLAECIEFNNGQISMSKSFKGNELRIICESYCKDLVDVLSSKLGYDEEELLNLISLKSPEYKFRNKVWSEEVRKLTVGSALFILSVLLNEAFPDKKNISENLLFNLRELNNKLLNPTSHHNSFDIDTVIEVKEIYNILNLTKELIIEMPWHFFPIQRNGYQPTILTGNAWSHSHKENRQLSIILWSDDYNSEKMLIWNPSRLNPVIPDPIIIMRQ